MDIFEEIANERRGLAGLLNGLTVEQRATQSLRGAWNVRGGGLVPQGALDGLRVEATDVDWAHGSGPTVRGDAAALLLAMTGRSIAFGQLRGDGICTLRSRLS